MIHMQPLKTRPNWTLEIGGPRDEVGSGGQGVDLQVPRVSRGKPTGSQVVKGLA